ENQAVTSLADAGTRLLVVQVPLARAHRLDLTSPSDLHTGFGALMGLHLRHARSSYSLYRLEAALTTRPRLLRLLNGPSPDRPSGGGSCSCPCRRSSAPSRRRRAR